MLADFFATARERERIRLSREAGQPAPWTEDPILANFYFCNVRREDDRTTRWLRELTTELMARNATASHIIKAVTGFRWFNRIETGERIRHILLKQGWNEAGVRKALAGGGQLWSGAYIIMPAPGKAMPKMDGVCACMAALDSQAVARVASGRDSLEQTWLKLREYPGMGPFMAYEVISDLRWTMVLRGATDIHSWANPGPGCVRGLQWVFEEKFNRTNPRTLAAMRDLLAHSRREEHWPADWPAWEMREVEHWLCEYDKIRRGRQGSHLKRRYRP